MPLLFLTNNILLKGNLYLDPGSGSFLLQLLVGGFVGALFAVKVYWRKITAFFKGEKSEPLEEESGQEND